VQSTTGRDLVVGGFVLVGLLAVAYLSFQVGGLSYKGPGGLVVRARFDEIGGLSARAPVVISGVKVGQVISIELDDDLRAEVAFEIDQTLELPVDTSASIRTSGLLGDQYIALEPGGEIDMLGPGDVIDFTESALNLEKLIGTLVHDTDLGGDGS
jgi:phospholipid/cholesterol/gamma-HCH transport system substrate-binding protein